MDLWPVKFANKIDAALKIKIGRRQLAAKAGWLITVQSSTVRIMHCMRSIAQLDISNIVVLIC